MTGNKREVIMTPKQVHMLVTKLYTTYLKYEGPIFLRTKKEDTDNGSLG